jgi:hypothetical protein
MTALINRGGRVWPTDHQSLAARFGSRCNYVDSLTFAVEELGCIYLNLMGDLLFATFRPVRATRFAVIGAFYLISELPARRVVLVYDGISEICSTAPAAMRRMETLIGRLHEVDAPLIWIGLTPS